MQTKLNQRLAQINELGPLVSHHPVSQRSRWGNLIVGGVCLSAALVVAYIIYPATLDFTRSTANVRLTEYPSELLWPAALATVSLLAGLWLFFITIRDWHTTAAIYEDGLALSDHTGLHQIPWENITRVWQAITRHHRNGIYTHTTHVYTVQTNTGQKLKFDNKFVQIESLGNTIQQKVSILLLPAHLHALNNGQQLNFGPLALDRQGLHTGSKSLPWAATKAIKIHNGLLTIKKNDEQESIWSTIFLPDLPNYLVFYEIAGQLTHFE